VGNLQNFVYPNGVTHAYTYDTLNRLTQMGSSKNGSLSNYVYTLGAAGNRMSVSELTGRTVAYAYDSLYRLTTETVTADPHSKNGVASYTYDSVGNRKTLSSTLPPAGAMNYTYDPDDRLGTDQYDPDGNTVGSGGITNTYDFENHLITHGGVTIVYDGDGNRVSETVAGVTTNYLVDTQNPTGYAQVVDELQNGSVTKTYAYGLERISQNWQLGTSNWQPNFYGYDGHGSVRQLTNSAGAVTDTYDYDAFGNLINQTGSTPNNYLFAGEQFDSALGLYYNRARYLNTATGRFWSMDTIEGNEQDPLSLHKYLYAGANPANRIDPSGHESIAELDISSAISETLDAISNVQQIIRVKNEISTVLDVLSAIKDLGILLATEGDSGVLNLASKIESAAIDRLGKEAVNLPLMLFESIESNAARIAQTNLLSPAKDVKLAGAFSAPDAAILLYLPGVIGAVATFPTGLKVAGRPLELTSQGGLALLGMGFAGGGSTVQLFHVDLVVPFVAPGHEGPTPNDIDSWYDGTFLNYQVPR
jgi:RHS repeat-associated protein